MQQAADVQKRINALQDAIRKLQEDATARIAKLELGNRKYNLQKSKQRWDVIKSVFSGMSPLFKDFSPYLVLILLVALLIGIAAAPMPKIFPGRKLPTSGWDKLKAALKNILEKLFPVSTMRKWFNPFGKVDSIERTQNAGRCDNAKWRELIDPSEPYGGGFCKKTYIPKPYSWTIDTNKLPEFNKLPEKLRDQITKNGAKTQIYIPFELQSTFYVPQCDKAYYLRKQADGTEVQVKVEEPLLIDNGLTCSLAQHSSGDSQPYSAKYRKKSDNKSASRDKLTTCKI